jgi:hypothetical protein
MNYSHFNWKHLPCPGSLRYRNRVRGVTRVKEKKMKIDTSKEERNIWQEQLVSRSLIDFFSLLSMIWFSVFIADSLELDPVLLHFSKLFGYLYYAIVGLSFFKALLIWASPFLNVLRRLTIGIWYPHLIPQSGFTKVDPFIKEVVLIASLIELLRDARTKRARIAAVTMYLQAHTKESIFMFAFRKVTKLDWSFGSSSDDRDSYVESIVEEAFGNDALGDESGELLNENSGEVLRPQLGEEVAWCRTMDDAFTNWKSFRHSTVAKKFTHFVNIIVSAGLCETTGVEFKLGNVHLFTPVVTKKQLAAGDVFEAFYEAATGFIKGGYRVYQTGEVSSFYTEDDRFTEFDRKFNQIKSWHGYAICGNLQQYTEIDDNEYDKFVAEAIEFGDNLMKSVKRSETFERKYLGDRLNKIRDYHVEFTQLRTRGGLRMSPFSVCLFGRSGCGKSSLTNLTVKGGLAYNELCFDADRIATWADNDKYASSIRSHINAIIFDDFANTKENFMDFSPAYRLIQVINNVKYLAPMADVFLKGKVSLNPYFCVISTNVEHLNAAVYSNEPESVLRRMYHVKVVPIAKYCTAGILDKEKILKAFGHTSTPNVWKLTVRKYHAVDKRGLDMSLFKPIKWNGRVMENLNVYDYMEWVQKASKLHFTDEGQYLANQADDPVICEECNLAYCKCCKTESKEQVLEENAGVYDTWYSVNAYCQRRAENIRDHIREQHATGIVAMQNLCNWWERFDCMPEYMICHPRVLKCCLFFWREEIKNSLYAGYSFIVFMLFAALWSIPCLSVVWVPTSLFAMYYYTCATMQTYQLMARERILELKTVVKTYTNSWQMKWALLGLGALGIVFLAFKKQVKKTTDIDIYDNSMIDFYNCGRVRDMFGEFDEYEIKEEDFKAQSGLNPENMDDIAARDSQENQWAQVERSEVPMSEPATTTTSDNLANSMRTNIVGVISETHKTTLAFYICSNFVLIPTHFIKKHNMDDIRVRVYKTKPEQVGSYFRETISKEFSYEIPDTDLTLCYMTSGGSMKDFRAFLPLVKDLGPMAAKLVTRGPVGRVLKSVPTFFEGSTTVRHTSAEFAGGYYTLPGETIEGMCMSPLISDRKGSMILGFHLGGLGNRGGCGTVTHDQITEAILKLSAVDGVVLSASSGNLIPNMGDFPTETFGKRILESEDIHMKSATRFLPFGAFISVFGSTSGKATPNSRVEPTIISDNVEEVFGEPQKWGPPKMKGKGRYPYQATLQHSSVPSLPVGGVLRKAVTCMKSISTEVKKKLPELFKCGPLSRVATVSGLKGVRFIDPMNFNTSPGFPMSGSKRSLLVDLDPEEYPECGKPRTFVKEVWDEFDKAKEILMTGKRCYVIWKACLKDEPTKKTKDKVRVFQSAPLVMQLLIRMYFLPLIRIIQMNPMAFECAVGINAEGLDWEEIWEYAMEKGKDRVLAGDYAKYDIRMSAQLTLAAFDVLLDIASKCEGYTEDDLTLMRNLVHEVVYPVLAMNGDLIELFGTNPSGQNLTVIINSIVNSLLLRSCFYTFYPDKVFKKCCSFLTYGDDVIGTVIAGLDKFTHITYAKWLSKFDMKFTMPDKESEPTHYMKEEDVDFLKRKSQFNEDLGVKVGLLSEDSIYKRLHSHLLSKELTKEEHSAENIASSLHDWFYYGREVFEDRQKKLKEVAQKSGIEHLCPALNVSYDRRVAIWRYKYLGEELEEEEEEVLNENCGSMVFVDTVDINDHCIGSAHDPYFWWEHVAADLGLVLVPVLWFLLLTRRVKATWGFPTRGWIWFLCFTTDGFKPFEWMCWFIRFLAVTYFGQIYAWTLVYVMGEEWRQLLGLQNPSPVRIWVPRSTKVQRM